jgi:hypothetical protein
MSIRTRVSAYRTADSISEFEAAAEQKYEDGFNLLASNTPGNGVYLMGLAAEMLLKSAYFRFIGYATYRPVQGSDLHNAQQEASRLGVVAACDHYHNPEFWSELLIKKRVQIGNPLQTTLEAGLASATSRLSQNWWIGMRYVHFAAIDKTDLDHVLDDVVWIKSNHDALWR